MGPDGAALPQAAHLIGGNAGRVTARLRSAGPARWPRPCSPAPWPVAAAVRPRATVDSRRATDRRAVRRWPGHSQCHVVRLQPRRLLGTYTHIDHRSGQVAWIVDAQGLSSPPPPALVPVLAPLRAL